MSTGATLSADQKRAFQRRLPNAVIFDMIGASEGGPYALSMTMPGTEPPETAVFTAPPNVVTIDPATGDVLPRGSETPGMLGAAGPMPRGYWRDEAKTAETFRTIDGVRYTVPGDFATIAEDGTVTLLGRGSVCINSGGEKIYPEEVEVAARLHRTVIDANAVGVPHERFGETVVLVCSVSEPTDEADVIATVKADDRRLQGPPPGRVRRRGLPGTQRQGGLPLGPRHGASRHGLIATRRPELQSSSGIPVWRWNVSESQLSSRRTTRPSCTVIHITPGMSMRTLRTSAPNR